MAIASLLSAAPQFLRSQNFWKRILDPLASSGREAEFAELRLITATHRWAIDSKGFEFSKLSQRQTGIIDVAQSILERGAWTLPTWRMEQYLATRAEEELGWRIVADDPVTGNLGFSIESAAVDSHFQNCLSTARWPCEIADINGEVERIWQCFEGEHPGSAAEEQFFHEVLAPVLGFPLLDLLRLQPALVSLGLDPLQFAGQRADFSLLTGRGLKLIIEIDGEQHQSHQSQRALDSKRDLSLRNAGWHVWRIKTSELSDAEVLTKRLHVFLNERKGRTDWGCQPRIDSPRPPGLMTCIWGATVATRLHFLLLEALRRGVLPWDRPWRIAVVEAETEIADVALKDFQDWFGRLRELFGESVAPEMQAVSLDSSNCAQFVVDLSVIEPHRAPLDIDLPIAWSRPGNLVGQIPKRTFSTRVLATEPTEFLIESFVQDFLRKSALREGQLQIITRILAGKDSIGLLPTGGGKSLTYQLCGLLLGGLTIYVSPLKSLLQDQRERFLALGVDLVQEISSALSASDNQQAGYLLTAGGVRFLLIAPERFLIEGFRQQLAQFRVQFGEVSQVVIDECHCVSEWGHDFRPAYLSLSRIVKERTTRLGMSAPLVALTGTASSIVLSDMKRELGVVDDEAIIRAKRLDRPEISMSCVKLRSREKPHALRQSLQDFITRAKQRDGLLVFSRFIGGLEGVVGITASAMEVVPIENLRLYTGTAPKWKQFAAFITGRKSKNISDTEARAMIPLWALSPDGHALAWEEVKAKVQSDFISGLPGSYQVLIATNAFGMGIDKPTIRRVIHYVTPQSPEAFYQEVGRAGRDKNSSDAILLFSDEEPEVTDRILDPGRSIAEARQTYRSFTEMHPYQGGDFVRTFYFHQNSFSGPEQEARVATLLLREIRRLIDGGHAMTLEYAPGDPDAEASFSEQWRSERNLEYGIVRLIILGVVRDYTKNYNAKQFELMVEPDWESLKDDSQALATYLAAQFRAYAHRYQTLLKTKGEEEILAASTIQDIEAATAEAIIEFVYEQVERKRRQASRQMLELARIGVTDASLFRERLNHYLQASEKFTTELETLVQGEGTANWKDLLDAVGSRDELAELHGACQRVLESYPTHPALLSISASTRLRPSKNDLNRSEEELKAALRYMTEAAGVEEAKLMGDTVAAYVADVDEVLAERLDSVFGLWLVRNDRTREAVTRFFVRKAVRDHWMGTMIREVRTGLPDKLEI